LPGTTTSPAIGGTGNTLAEEYRQTLAGLLARQREARAALAAAGSGERHALARRLALLREMVRDVREVLRRLDPPRPRPRAGGWARLDGARGDALEYLTWQQLESFANDNSQELSWRRAVVDDGTAALTPRQRQVFLLFWRAGKSRQDIAALLGRDPSTISRTLERAADKLRRYADARTLAAGCVRGDGSVDLERLIRRALVLTPRQRQILLLYLSGLPVWGIAGKLGVQGCTVTRTRQRGEANLRRLVGVMSRRELSAQGWQATCRELAEAYGLGLGAVYKVLGGLQPQPDGLTLLQREIRARRAAGRSTASIARELDLSANAVRRALRQKRG